MSPADPSNPSQELAARTSWVGPTLANGVLTAELAAFCQSGVSIVMASSDTGGRPVVGRGSACLIGGAGQIRILVRRPPNVHLLQALAGGAGLAVTFTRPTTHRSIQLKARGAQVDVPRAADYAAVAAQTGALGADIVACGYAEAVAAGYTTFERHDLAAVDFLPDRAFVQTPGLLAGSALPS